MKGLAGVASTAATSFLRLRSDADSARLSSWSSVSPRCIASILATRALRRRRNEPRFAPDVLAALDLEAQDRTKWVVSAEGKGLDLVIEVHYRGDPAKDYELNVERYARLGIREYFIFDRALLSLRGYRLPGSGEGRSGRARAYRPILPQLGRYTSEVLGLDLMIEDDKLRFLLGMAAVPETEELLVKLGSMLNQVLLHKQEAEEQAQAEAAHARAEAERAASLEQRLAETERKLAEATALIEQLKRGE